MMTDDLTCVNVTEGALIEFIERVVVAGGSDIKVSQGDSGWYVTYKPPFTRDIKADTAEEYLLPKNQRLITTGPLYCQSCAKIKVCRQMYVESGVWPAIHDGCFVPELHDTHCTSQEIAEADCEGDRTECGDACHAKH